MADADIWRDVSYLNISTSWNIQDIYNIDNIQIEISTACLLNGLYTD